MRISRFRFFVFAALLAVFYTPARAEDCSCNPLADAFKAQVLMAEKERYAAMTKVDANALDKLLADDLIYAHSNGQVQSKTDLLADLTSGKMRYSKIEPRTSMVRLVGDIAIVNGANDFEIVLGGTQQKARLVFTAVYILKGEGAERRWQLMSWHSSSHSIKPAN